LLGQVITLFSFSPTIPLYHASHAITTVSKEPLVKLRSVSTARAVTVQPAEAHTQLTTHVTYGVGVNIPCGTFGTVNWVIEDDQIDKHLFIVTSTIYAPQAPHSPSLEVKDAVQENVRLEPQLFPNEQGDLDIDNVHPVLWAESLYPDEAA
jgi:hypothetical protein